MKHMTEKLQRFFDVGVMAIVRIDSQENVNPTIEALLKKIEHYEEQDYNERNRDGS